MSVIVIGNRKVGKTSMVVTLAKGTENVRVIRPDPESLIERLSNLETGELAGTAIFGPKKEESLLLSVNLPSGREKEIPVRWIDTAGEVWSSEEWREKNRELLLDIIQTVSKSRAVLLLLPPYLYRSRTRQLDEETTPKELDPETWKTQLTNWLAFLREYCSPAQHILIIINKADLFSNNLDQDEKDWHFDPLNPQGRFRWDEYDDHIRNTYFDLAYDIIREHNAQPPYLTPHFFVTTIFNQSLLELPWVYLGSHLAHV